MGLETATYISDFVVTNPPTTDSKQQGDDHLRLIKTVLKNTFPGGSKAIYFPTSSTKSATFTVLAAEQNNLFVVDTTAGVVTMNLPTLVAGDAGWECSLLKTNTGLNPVLIDPPGAATVQSGDQALTTSRRCIPGVRTKIFWTGSNWIADRAVGVPVGVLIPFSGASLPVGFEWPTGQVLASASANYPDYFARMGSGTTVDVRNRAIFGTDNMGGAGVTGRITAAGSGLDGTTHGAGGGNQFLQSHGHTLTGSTGDDTPDHTHPYSLPTAFAEAGGVVANLAGPASGQNTGGASNRHGHPLNGPGAAAVANGSGTSQNVPPALILNEILVVE